jgi:RNA polymerase sigma-70 factor (ECF subfamily)
LVELAREGDLGAFNSLVGRWQGSLHGFVTRTLGDPEDAQDVCQETLVKAYRNIRRLRDGGKFKAWIHHIALNICRDRFRSARSRGEALPFEEGVLENLDHASGREPVATTDQEAQQSDLQSVLTSVLSALPVEQRDSILLREYQGFTSEEIGEIMGVPAATVRTRIYYGLKSMRKTLRARGIAREDLS